MKTVLVFLLLAFPSEPEITQFLAKQRMLQPEVLCPDGSRADLVSPSEALEVEWAAKWKEAPGQAVLYSIWLERKPAIILLSKDPLADKIHILRCRLVCERLGIRLEVLDVRKLEIP